MSFLKKYKTKIILITIIIIACSSAAYFSGDTQSFYANKIPKIDSKKSYEVIHVSDGDTFEIRIDGQTVTIRMLGIDTPETIDPRKPVQCFGKEASDATKEMLDGHFVTLVTDSTQSITDKYGRLLAYVYRDDGLFMNQFLLANGYAREYTYGKAYKMQKDFRKLEREAKREKKGLWELPCLQK